MIAIGWELKNGKYINPSPHNRKHRSIYLERPSPMTKSELKICPWCGLQPIFKRGKIRCVNTDCKIKPVGMTWYCCDKRGYDLAKNDWNTRKDSL
jgi:hypothetical protein